MKTITMTLYRRPKYNKIVFDALEQCIGIDDYIVVIYIEPSCPEVLGVAEEAKIKNKIIIKNKEQKGIALNVYSAVEHGFSLGDFNIHIEGDCVPAPDTLLYFEFCKRKYINDETVYTVCGYSRSILSDLDENKELFYQIDKKLWFTPWIWGTWKTRWEEPEGMKTNWDFNYQYGGWGPNLLNRLRKDRFEISPRVSRSKNIGLEKSVHMTKEILDFITPKDFLWAGDKTLFPNMGCQGFVEVGR